MRPSKGGKTPATAPTVPTDIETSHLSLPERLDAAFVAESTHLWDAFGTMGRTLLVDASNVTFIDSTGVGALIRLRKLLREKEAELVLVGPSAALLHGLEMMKLAKLFPAVPDWGQARFWQAQNVSVQSHHRGDRARLDWSGDVTAETVEDVWGRTVALLETRAHREAEMAIDLNQVSFMDSAGLGFMVRVRRTARQRGVSCDLSTPANRSSG